MVCKNFNNKALVSERPCEKARRSPTLETLEQRILFSADLLGLDGNPDKPGDDLLEFPATQLQAPVAAAELVFIDLSIPQSSDVLADLNSQIANGRLLDVIPIDASEAGLDLMTQTLKDRSNVQSVHIISHGTSTGFALGSQWLDQSALQTHQSQLNQWRASLTDDADILLYGCNLAATDSGQVFLNSFANLTSADVAASSNITGHSRLNGDWALEYSTGAIQSDSIISTKLQQQWENQLAVDLLAVDDNLDDALINSTIELNNPSATETNILNNDQTSAAALKLLNVSGASNGTISPHTNGEFTYQPDNNYTGTESFDYIVTDSEEPILNHYALNSASITDETGRSSPITHAASNDPSFDGSEFDFDGVDDYIEIPDIDYSQSFTISIDFRIGDINTNRQQIFSHGAGYEQNSIQAWIENTTLFISLSDSAETGIDASPHTIDVGGFSNTGDWHNLQITHAPYDVATDTGRFTVFLDGIDQNAYQSTPRGGDLIDPSSSILLGAYRPTSGTVTDFLDTHDIRDLRVYSDTVTPLAVARDIDYSSASVNVTIKNTNQVPVFSSLDATPTYTENTAPVVLDSDVTVSDPELSAQNNYAGSTLTLVRSGGANIEDQFQATGNLISLTEGQPLSYTDIVVGVVDLGTVIKNSDGELQVEFNSLASQDLVNKSLQSIGYSNASESPPGLVSIEWQFNDGYSGSPVFGAAKSVSGNTLVSINEIPDIAIDLVSLAKSSDEDTALVLSNEITVTHDQNPSEVVTADLTVTNGTLSIPTLPAVTITGNTTSAISLTGSLADVNTLLQSITYTPISEFHGNDSLFISASVGSPAYTTTATMGLVVQEVNDTPVINDYGTYVTHLLGGPVTVIDSDISISDLELTNSANYAGTTLSLTRANAVDYAPTPQFSSNPTDVFSASTQTGDLLEGSNVTDGATIFGSVITNSDGILTIAFNGNATKARIDALMQSIEYRNSSTWPADSNSWPHDEISLKWTFNDNGINESGVSIPYTAKDGIGYSHIDLSTTDTQPLEIERNDLYLNTGAPDQLLDRSYLLYVDVDTADSNLDYTITSYSDNNIYVKKNGIALVAGQSFSQADINLGIITVGTTATSTKSESFDFEVSGHSSTINSTFYIEVTNSDPSELLSGLRMNLDGGNDAFLGDTEQFKFMNNTPGFDKFTFEFTVSGLQANPGLQETTLYSGVGIPGRYDGHSEHLVIKPVAGTDDGIIEWDTELYNPSSGGPAISALAPGVFDGGIHFIALTFEMQPGGTVELYYDGTKTTAPNNETGNFVWGGDFPRVFGQQLLDGSVFGAPEDFDGYLFDQGKHFSGTFHEIRVWNVIRSQSDIDNHISGRYDPYPTDKSDLIVDWHMHDPNGDKSAFEIIDTTATEGADEDPQPILKVGHATGSGFKPSTPTDELVLAENATPGTVVGYVQPQEPDPDHDGYTYAITPQAGQTSPFSIEADTGRITLDDPALLPAGLTTYPLRVTVDDPFWSETVPIHITAINDAPVLNPGSNAPAPFIEGDAAIILNPEISVEDTELEASDFSGATLTIERTDASGITPDPQLQDQFSSDLFASAGGLYSVDQTSSRLQLTFNSGATKADVDTVLQSIKYQNTSDDPQSNITLTWTFSDGNTGTQGKGGALTDSVQTSVSITPVNDPPVLSSFSSPFISIAEDTSIDIFGSDLLPYATDDGDISEFLVTAYEGSLLTAITGTVASDKYVWTPPADATGIFRAFDVQAKDDSGALSADIESVYIEVTQISDEPSGTDSVLEIPEDSTLTLDPGHFGFTDADSDTFSSILLNSVTNATLQRAGVGVTVPMTVTIGDLAANPIEVVPPADLSEQSISLSFQVIDDGANSTDSTANTLTINIIGVNDPPTSVDHLVSTTEDNTLTFTVGDFAFNDNTDITGSKPAGDDPYSIILVSLPATGELLLNEIPLYAGDEILYSEITSLTYVPEPDSTTASFFDYSVRDLGGTDDGGIDISTSSYRIDLLITAENDPSVLTGVETFPTTFSTSPVVITDTITIADIDDTLIESALVKISNNFIVGEDMLIIPAPPVITANVDLVNGEIHLSGSASVSDYEAAMRSIQYQNSSGNPTTQARTVSFTVNDGDTDSNSVSRTINITDVNDAPSLSAMEVGNAVHTEGASPTVITDSLVVTDVDNTQLTSAQIEITGNFEPAEDQLLFADQSGITGAYNSFSGVLSLTGVAPTSAYQDAIRSVTYQNISDTPSTVTRSISVSVNDGDLDSNISARNITVIATNDAPTITTIEPTNTTYTENNSPVSLTDTLTINDADDTLIESASISISSNFISDEDVLGFTNQSGITGSFDNATGILSLSGTATIVDYQNVLRSVSYINNSDNPTITPRIVSFSVSDANNASNSVSRTIDISAENDAPTLSAIETSNVLFTENSTPVTITNNLVVSDIDNTHIDSANVQITGNFSSVEDQLLFTDQSGISGIYNSLTGILSLTGTASTLAYQDALRSVVYQNTSDSPATLARTLSISINDGALDSNVAVRNIDVFATNDPPTLATIEASNATYMENAAPLFVTSSLTTADVDDAFIDFATVSISGNFISAEDSLGFTDQSGINGDFNNSTGILSLSGTATLNDYQDALRSVTYVNSSDNPTVAPRTISIMVNDGDDDSNIVSRIIDINAENDAPSISAIEFSSVNYTEGDGMATVTNTLTIADRDNTHIQSAIIAIATNYLPLEDVLAFVDQPNITGSFNSSNGELSLSGLATVGDYENAIRTVTYENTSLNPSTSNRTISFQVNDGSQDSNSVFREIVVNAVNNAPALLTIESTNASFTENNAPTIVTDSLSIKDHDSSNIVSATVSITGNFSASQDKLLFTNQSGITGNYDSLNGVMTLTGPASLNAYKSALTSVSYENTSENPDIAPRTVTFQVSDGNLNSNSAARDMEIVATNDSPVVSNIEGTHASYSENGTPIAITDTLKIADMDDTAIDTASVKITGNFVPGEDVLSFIDQSGISGVYDSVAGEMTLSGSAFVTDYQNAIRSVTYHNISDNPSLLPRTVIFSVFDGEGQSNSLGRDVDVSPINDSPVLHNIESGPATYTEGGPGTAITATLSITDIDDSQIEGAVVSISGNYIPTEDILDFSGMPGIISNFNPVTGELTLTGTASLSDYETALRNVVYRNTSDNPNQPARTISFIVNDGENSSTPLSRSVVNNATNDAPGLQNIESSVLNYIENSPPIEITDTLTIVDVDDLYMESATVTVTNNFVPAEDILAFSDQLGITGAYNSTTGQLTLSGTATVADYQTALRAVTYQNTSDDPDSAARTITFVINDGNENSPFVSRQLALEIVNDPPVLSSVESTPVSFTENGTPVAISSSIVVDDTDDVTIESATIQLTNNFFANEDRLHYNTVPGITGNYDSTTGILTLSGSAAIANYESALRSVYYENISDNPSIAVRTVSVSVYDGDTHSNTITRDIVNQAINDAPVISSIENTIAEYTENAIPLPITNNLTIDDIDSTLLTESTIAISNNFTPSEDVLVFSDQSGISGNYDPVVGILTLNGTASLANYQEALRSITYVNTSDNPSAVTRAITISVKDDTDSSNSLSRSIDITPVNDAPSGNDFTLNVLEDSHHQFISSEFGFTDILDSHEFKAIHVNSLPAIGELLLGSNSVAVNDVIGKSDIDNGLLKYVAPADSTFNTITSFNFSVQDTGGDTHGGADIDSTPNTVTVTNIAVNDPPVISEDLSVSTLEDAAYILKSTDFAYADPEGHTLKSIIIESVPIEGILKLNNIPVLIGDVVSAGDILDHKLVYHPSVNSNGTTSFSFRLQDTGNTANGGADTSTAAADFSIVILPVNDEPLGQSAVVSLIEDTPYLFSANDFQIVDIEDHSLQEIIITQLPLTGALLLNQSAVQIGDHITATHIADGLLVYVPEENSSGINTAGFSFYVKDTGGNSNGGENTSTTQASIQFDIVPVNDSPMGADLSVSAPEDSTVVLTTSMFGYSDVDNHTLSGVQIATLPQKGMLIYNNQPVAISDVIPADEIQSDLLKFVPDSHAHGQPYAQISFYVIDSGLTQNISVNANVLTINITPTNDHPSVNNTTVSLPEDSRHTFSLADFAYSDQLDAPDENNLLEITLQALPLQGKLMIDNSPLSIGDNITSAQIQAGSFEFVPDENTHGEYYADFEFVVRDDGGTEDGGSDTSVTTTRIIFSVSNTNDLPTATTDNFTVDESSSFNGSLLDNDFDIDPNTTLVASLLTPPAHGNLEFNPDGSFFYSHDGSETISDFFSYEISDGDLTDSTTVNITVIPVNDPPSAMMPPLVGAVERTYTEYVLPENLFVDPDIGDTIDIRMVGPDGEPAPAWLEFDSATRKISGTPPLYGTFVVRLVATDQDNAEVFTDLVIQVEPNDAEPQVGAALGSSQNNDDSAGSRSVALGSADTAALSFNAFANNPTAIEKEEAPEESPRLIYALPDAVGTEKLLTELVLEQHNKITKAPQENANVLDAIAVEVIPPLEDLFQLDNPLLSQSSNGFFQQLDSNKQEMTDNKKYSLQVTSGVTGISASLSIGYIVWLLRGGILISSVLTSLPAWRMIDPLPVLNNKESGEENGDDESLHEMVNSKDRPASKNQANLATKTSDISANSRSRN